MQMEDLLSVTHDPMLAKLRYNLRKEGVLLKDQKKSTIQCVYSKEEILNPWTAQSDDLDALSTGESITTSANDLNCHGYGSSVAVTASFGFCAAGWALDRLSRAKDSTR
jgi:tRNA A37 threonylcarbamoyladenosine dehydratase